MRPGNPADHGVLVKTMQDTNYKELREHGTSLMPIDAYSFYECHSRFSVSHHWHEEIELLYFEKGDFLLERDMRQENIGEGDLVFINRSELHQITGRNIPSIHHAIVFDMQVLKFERYDQAQGTVIAPLWNGACLFPGRITPQEEVYPVLLAEYLDILKSCTSKQPGWYLYVKASLFKILAILENAGYFRKRGNQELTENGYQVQEIKKILKYIEEHYREKIRLADLADTAGMNAQYFCRFFRRMTGKTPVDYINAYRIEHAAGELLERNAKIMEVCYENGFENFSYFIRKFKEYKGMTPKEYREGRRF